MKVKLLIQNNNIPLNDCRRLRGSYAMQHPVSGITHPGTFCKFGKHSPATWAWVCGYSHLNWTSTEAVSKVPAVKPINSESERDELRCKNRHIMIVISHMAHIRSGVRLHITCQDWDDLKAQFMAARISNRNSCQKRWDGNIHSWGGDIIVFS